MRFSRGPEIDFPRAAACTVSLLSVLFPSLRLSGGAQSLLNSNVSLPFLSYSPGEASIAWAVRLEPNLGSVGQRLLSPGSEPAQRAALRTPGELAEERCLLLKLHLALDRALRQPPVVVEHWEAGVLLSSMGERSGHPRANPVEFPFLSSVNFCAINIFSFSFWIQNLVQVGGSQANPSCESIDGY